MSTKPNLLFIFTDQQRPDTIGCYGNNIISTPNLNKLADKSFVFKNAYVTQPVCTPARSSIMTGLYPHTNGCTTNNSTIDPATKTVAELVSDEYVCGYYGKWHLGDEIIPQHGFEKRISIDDGYRPWYTKKEYLSKFSEYYYFLLDKGYKPDSEVEGTKIFGRDLTTRLPEEHTKARFLGKEASRFIRDNKDNPFVLYVNFFEPHQPYTGPFDNMYSREQLNTGPHFLKKPNENCSIMHRTFAEYYMQANIEGHDLKMESEWREIRAKYWGNITLVDRAIADILQTVNESKLDENTIIVFSSDHGDMMGDHGILEKTVLYEESIKIPLLLHVPWISNHSSMIEGRVSQIDLIPTILDLMKEKIPKQLEGNSLVPVLKGNANLANNDVIVQWNGNDGRSPMGTGNDLGNQFANLQDTSWRTLISHDNWKLNYSKVDQCELYNLNSDPHEQNNLYDIPEQMTRIQDMRYRINQWQKETNDISHSH